MSLFLPQVSLFNRLIVKYERTHGRMTTSVERTNMMGFPSVQNLVTERERSQVRPANLSADWLSHDVANPAGTPQRIIEAKTKMTRMSDVSFLQRQLESAGFFEDQYWLYALLDCASDPKFVLVQDPGRLSWSGPDESSNPHAKPGSPASEPRYWLPCNDVLEAGEVISLDEMGKPGRTWSPGTQLSSCSWHARRDASKAESTTCWDCDWEPIKDKAS
jgi:hypothetical protein